MSFDLDRFLPYQLSVAAAHISKRFAERYEAEAGLTIPEWRVLAHLNKSGVVSIRDVNARVNLDKSIVSRAASRLEEAGLVQKSGNISDKRLIALELSPKGKSLMRRLGRVAGSFQDELFAELGPEAEKLAGMLVQLAAFPQRGS